MATLHVTRIDSVGIVDAGDNPDAEIVFFKRKVGTEERERLADRGMALPDGSFPIASVADLRNAIKAYGRASNKAAAKKHIINRARRLGRVDLLPDQWGVSKLHEASVDSAEQPKEDALMEFDKSELSDEAAAAFAQVEEERDEALAKLAALETEPEVAEPVDVAKDLDGPVADLVKSMQAELEKTKARAEEAAAELAKERDDRLTKEYEAKAEAFVGVLGADPEDVAPVLKTLFLADADAASKLETWLATGAERVKPLLKSIGEGRGGDAATQIEQLAKEKLHSDPDIKTIEQARVAVRKERSDLAQAEREEREVG